MWEEDNYVMYTYLLGIRILILKQNINKFHA